MLKQQITTKTIFDIANANQQLSKIEQLALWEKYNLARDLIVSSGYEFTPQGIKECIENTPTRSQQAYIRGTVNAGLRAKDKLVYSMQALIIKRAEYYKNEAISFDEMCQICNLGIMKGLTKFTPKKNAKVSSYCDFWIKAYAFDALYRVNPIYVPAAILKEMNQFKYKFVSQDAGEKTLEFSSEDTPKSTTLNEVMAQLEEQEQDIITDAFGLEGDTNILTVALMNGLSFEDARKKVNQTLQKARSLEVAC